MRRMVRQVLFAYGFLTILPGLGRLSVDPDDTGKSTAFYPLVGFSIGLLAALPGFLKELSPFTLSVIICVSLLVLSRGLHADGLLDTFDGFLAGRKGRGDILRVMKDARLGALGFIGGFSTYALKIAFLHEILRRSSGQAFIGPIPLLIPVIPALSRGGVALACALFPYAGTENGLGRSFVSSVTAVQAVAAFCLMCAFSLVPGNLHGLLLPPAVFLFWAGWGALCVRKIGGVTGDTLGAGIELSELFALMLALAL